MPHKNPLEAAASKRAYYLAHKDIFLARSTARRLQKQAEAAIVREANALLPKPVVACFCEACNADITLTYKAKHGKKCTACLKAVQSLYRANNAQRIAGLKKEWKLKNKEHVEAKDRAYAQLHPDRRTLARRKWSVANPGKDNASKTLNSIARKKRILVWLSEDDKWMLDQAYELAALRTKMFGFAWHVDHIIPLNGRKVSGLHTPYNVQVIPWLENLRKSNRVQHGQ